jgi:uncharacterized membrane protein
MSDYSSRLSAAFAYVPVIGWLYVLLLQRGDPLAVFHLKQSIGIFAFLIAILLAWIVVAYVLAWLPFMVILSAALFTIVMVAYIYGAVAWIMGLVNALRSRSTPLPVFGHWANRLPIR